MGNRSFENFGYVSEKSSDYTVSASRYLHQKKFEKKILQNIKSYLKFEKGEKILDIGCNVGTHFVPLFKSGQNIFGTDHKKCLNVIKKRIPKVSKKRLISGNFLKIKFKHKFDKIICYSVLHYLSNEKELIFFVNKIISILKKDGVALLGDIPNKNLENSFYNSSYGKKWMKKFNYERKKNQIKKKKESISQYLRNVKKDNVLIKINDKVIDRLIKFILKKNVLVKRKKQSRNSAFGPTREDLVLSK